MRKNKRNYTSKGIVLVLTTAIISGFAIFVNKFGIKGFDPYLYTFLKNLIVSLLLASFLLGVKESGNLKKLKKREWFLLSIIGLVGGSAPFLLFFKGLSLTSAANGAFIHKTMFIYVAILAGIFLKEKISSKLLIAGILILIGNLYFLKLMPYSSKVGDFLILLATLFWALENVISKYTLKTLSPRVVAFGRMGIGSIFIALFLIFTNRTQAIFSLSLLHWQWILISGIILFGYVTTWYTGLKYISVSTATIILLLGSPVTTFLSFIFLRQDITSSQLLGISLLMIGIAIAVGFRLIWQVLKDFPRLIHVIRA